MSQPLFTDLVSAARHWCARQPDKLAYGWLEDGVRVDGELTYGELDRRARSIAATLQARELGGERVILLFAPGLDYVAAFWGCLYAGAVPVPVYPPEPHRLQHTVRRLESIIADAQASVVFSTAPIRGMADQLLGSGPGVDLGWLTVEEADQHPAEDWVQPPIDGETLAFLQYTSGSTADPKGVMVRHRSVTANIRMLQEAYGLLGDEEVTGSWLPMYHDMGLIGVVLLTVFQGASAYLMPPWTFLKRPACWLEVMSRFGVTSSAAPNFALDLCVNKVPPDARAGLDLSRLRVLVNGAEPVRPETVERFHAAFGPWGLGSRVVTPSFGLAEVGLFASCDALEQRPTFGGFEREALERGEVAADGDGVRLTSAGKPWAGARFAIVDPETRQRVGERVGEIWIAGEHVADGYWNRPELSRERFGARIPGDEQTWLRTGDLGFIADGHLYITGRRKDLVIVRGRNLYPQDVERTVDALRDAEPAIRPGCAAAVADDEDGREGLAVLLEVDPRRDPSFDPQRTLASVASAVTDEHGISPSRVLLLQRGTLPKTSSGKVMRHACARALCTSYAEVGIAVVAERRLEHIRPPSFDPAMLVNDAVRAAAEIRDDDGWFIDAPAVRRLLDALLRRVGEPSADEGFGGDITAVLDALGGADRRRLEELAPPGDSAPSARSLLARLRRMEGAAAPDEPAPAAPDRGRDDEVQELSRWIVAELASELELQPAALTRHLLAEGDSFSSLGVDSMAAVQLVAALEQRVGRALPADVLQRHDGVETLARYVLGRG